MVTLVFFPFNGKYKKHQNTEGDPIYKSAILQKKAHNNEGPGQISTSWWSLLAQLYTTIVHIEF